VLPGAGRAPGSLTQACGVPLGSYLDSRGPGPLSS